LKYLDTSRCCYLQRKAPGCGSLLKNINITKENQRQILTDSIVCAGELKTTDIAITKSQVVGQLSRYLHYLLIEQKRDKIYGFLTNAQEITFYCLEKVEGLNL
jgi:Holliday junction resolvasome RuvABC DNA-binding subunit